MKGIARAFGGRLLRLLAPVLEARGRRPIEEQRAPEQLLHRAVHFGSQRGDHPAQPLGLAALFLELFEVVADGLFAGQRRKRSENGRKETDRFALVLQILTITVGARVDIEEASVDLALRGAPLQCGNGPGEGLVHQHRPVDERHIAKRLARGMDGHHAVEKSLALGPGALCEIGQAIDFLDPQRRKRPREAGRGPSGEDKLERIGEILPALHWRARTEGNRHAVFGIFDHRWTVEPQ